jgi:2-polyprenyl-6-methoxyphenol hydroxylase-like FAD-dependent oxidoreductase
MGGSVAILGAAALGEALQRHPGDVRTAFQKYEESFRPTAEAIQAHAVEIGLEMFMPRSEEAIHRRNMVLGLS